MDLVRKRLTYTIALIFVAVLTITQAGWSQFDEYNHPELKWRTLETEHFFMHYHQGVEKAARTALAIAEQIYEPITTMYDYEPDGKVHLVMRDHDDYSNGGAYYYDNKIELWARPLNFELRGTHHWMYDVVTHEFTHIIQLGASRKGPRWLPAVYFQAIAYEPEKRPDVLRGYPNQIASVPVALTNVPMWFAEGTAQYQTRELCHDWWDAHRDMNLRVRALEDDLLTYNQMGVFGKNSIDAESVYNHGLSLVRYIASTYGDETLKDLSHDFTRIGNMTFSQASKHTLGISGKQLYQNWSDYLKEYYGDRMAVIRENTVSGKLVYDKGFASLYPSFSPNGKKIAFLTNEGQDYLSISKFVCFDIEKGEIIENVGPGSEKSKAVTEGQFNAPGMCLGDCKSPVRGAFNWSPDGRYIVYSRKSGPNRQGSHFNDIYLWDTVEEKDIRLTVDARLMHPSFAPDGRQIITVHNSGGTNNLVMLTLPDEIPLEKDISELVESVQLTHFDDGRQIYRPFISPDGKTVYLSTIDLDPRDIFSFDLTNTDNWREAWQPLVTGSSDDRDVIITPDGKSLIFASDRTGIFNIYRMNIADGSVTALTNVIGGAFMPTVSADGQIAYAEFQNGGYTIRWLKDPEAVDPEVMTYIEPDELERPHLAKAPSFDGKSVLYPTPFNKLFIIPRIAWDYGKFKPGIYAYTSDILNRLSLFSGVAIGEKGERDIYLNGEYHALPPTIFFEAFNVVRTHDQEFDDNYIIVGERIEDGKAVPIYETYRVDYKFNLTELDIGAKYPLFHRGTLSAALRNSRYRAVLDFDDNTSFDYTYHKGNVGVLRLDADARAMRLDDDIHPRGGWRGWIEYGREWNNFLDGFEIEAEKGTIVEVYKKYNFDRFEADIDYYKTLWGDVVINPRVIGGALTRSVDSFYHLYAGGLPGMRGYSFYSLGGTKKLTGRVSLRLPLKTGIDKRVGPFYIDRAHLGLFAEAGDAWTRYVSYEDIKKDVGWELRLRMFSWYGYPTDIQLTGAYGFDKFTIEDDHGTFNTYGKEWRWYLTVLFDFI